MAALPNQMTSNAALTSATGGAYAVHVIITSSTAGDETTSVYWNSIEKLRRLFGDNYFKVTVVSDNNPNPCPLTAEKELLAKALLLARSNDLAAPAIIVKETSTSTLQDPYRMAERIREVVTKRTNEDLVYLCRWDDNCNQQGLLNNAGIRRVTRPTSTQAIMFWPNARDLTLKLCADRSQQYSIGVLLNDLVAQGKLVAAAFDPNLIDFDLDLARNESEYAKGNRCRLSQNQTEKPKQATKTGSALVVLLIALLAILVVVGYLLYQAWQAEEV